MIRLLAMNNLTIIILASFSVMNILYLASDLFPISDSTQYKRFEGCQKEEESEKFDCQKCSEFLNCESKKNEKIVRKTKTSTKSKILGNGDLVEQTTVTEVTETITHSGSLDKDDEVCSDEINNSYQACIETCEAQRKEEESKVNEETLYDDVPVVQFVHNSEEHIDDFNNESDIEDIDNESEQKHLVEQKRFLAYSIPNSTETAERSLLPADIENNDAPEKPFEDKKPPPPDIKLATGLQCCLSRLVTTTFRSWTFYLSGLIMDIPLYCTDRCLYTRENDSSSYCFSVDKRSSCTTNISSLMRLDQHNFRVDIDQLKTKEEIIAEQHAAPVLKLSGKHKLESHPCCPVKQVVGEDSSSGLYVLRGKTPWRRGNCSDNCVYIKVGDVRQSKYCFGPGNMETACHQKVPSISTLINTKTTLKQKPLALGECGTNCNVDLAKVNRLTTNNNIDKEKHWQNTDFEQKNILAQTNNLKVEPHKKLKCDKSEKKINDVKLTTYKTEKEEESEIPIVINKIHKLDTTKNTGTENSNKKKSKESNTCEGKGKTKNKCQEILKENTTRKPQNDNEKKIILNVETNKTDSAKPNKNNSRVKDITDTTTDNPKIKPCRPGCSDGLPMKLVEKDKKDITVNIENKDPADKIGDKFDDTIQIKCGMKFKMIKVKLQDTSEDNNPLDEQGIDKTKHNEKGSQLNNAPGKPLGNSIKLTKPFALEKKAVQENNNSKITSPTENLEKAAKPGKNKQNINITAIENSTAVGNDSTSDKNKSEGLKLNDQEKKVVVPFVYKLNKTRKELPPNEASETVETIQNMENCTKLKVEGKNTLPYRVTLSERPKLINRTKDPKNSVKSEMPLKIACCSGKPYKMKIPTKDKPSEPVEIDVEITEPQGFAPVKLLPKDTSVQMMDI